MKKACYALAAALALPAAAQAQSSVTISGFVKAGVEHLRLGDSAKRPPSEVRVVDDSSRLIFGIAEDLGGGLRAIAQLDMRVTIDIGTLALTGNNFVGLQSRSWGTLSVGRYDLHYQHTASEIGSKGASNKANNAALLSYAGGGGTGIATGNTRTANVVRWDSPKWGGFTLTAAYSANPLATEADIGSGTRKGRAWNLNPAYASGNLLAGYSHWDQKADAAGAGSDQRADRLYGSYAWGGLKIGLAWDRSKIRNGLTGAEESHRTAWSIPVRYATGRHTVYADYSRARDDKAIAGANGARMWALAYAYDFSKRTSIGVTYARVRNDAAATYNLFNATASAGSPSGAVIAGEDPRMIAVTVKHAF
jgi:predicted porin